MPTGPLLELLRLLPQNLISRAGGRLADLSLPRRLRPTLYRLFARAFGADLSEVELPLDVYPSFDAFFTRRLKPGCRPLDPDPAALLCPADGRVAACGPIETGRLLQAKGIDYRLADLLGCERTAGRFAGGSYLTVYLSPRDYHRVHSPLAGEVVRSSFLPGRLLPVFPASASRFSNLFAGNERTVSLLETDAGPVAVVLVGAMNVGRITLACLPGERTNDGRHVVRTFEHPTGTVPLARGAELGAFHLGSTVVVVLPAGRFEPSARCREGTRVRQGESLGRLLRPV